MTFSAGTPFTATTRPRSMGVLLVWVTPGSFISPSLKVASSPFGTSRKKKAGARSGIEESSSFEMLRSVSASVTKSVRPRPRARITEAAAEPGR